MAYVIAVCGAGGKSTYIAQRARAYLAEGMRAAVTTTTHIFDESGLLGSSADNALLLALQGKEGEGGSEAETDEKAERKITEEETEGKEEKAEKKIKKTEEKTEEKTESDREQLTVYKRAGIVYVGMRCTGKEAGKLKYPGDRVFEALCAHFDVVLVEADGARHMPLKIPRLGREPVIPRHTAEIVVVMGRHAVGRPFNVVCQRAEIAMKDGFLRRYQEGGFLHKCQTEAEAEAETETKTKAETETETETESSCHGGRTDKKRNESNFWDGTSAEREMGEDKRKTGAALSALAVTDELIAVLASHYYLEPLKKAYPDVKRSLYLSDFVRTYLAAGKRGRLPLRRPALILMASGFGRRFGANKLMAEYGEKPLILHGVEQLLSAAKLLQDALGINAPLILVTRYEEIRELPQIKALAARGSLFLCENPDYAEGISGSVRSGARFAAERGCTDFVYFAGDMPALKAEETARYILEYLASGKQFAVMEADGIPSNPGILSAAYLEEILSIHGDRGGMQVIRRYPEAVYHYPIAAAQLKDIDVKEDLIRGK